MGDPIAHGYDWAWAQIGGDSVKSNGGSFVVRYLGGSARITDQERRNLHADGVDILPVWETAADATEGGYARGLFDGRAANAELDALGWPSDGLVLYADDQNDPDPSQEVAYKRGVNDAGGRVGDLYSGGNVLVALDLAGLRTFGGWMVETWYPNAGADPFMVQLANSREPAMVGVDPGEYDTNLLYRPVPMWGPNGTTGDTTPKIHPLLFLEEPVHYETDPNDRRDIWEFGTAGRRHISGDEWAIIQFQNAKLRADAGLPEEPVKPFAGTAETFKAPDVTAYVGGTSGSLPAPTHFTITGDARAA